MLCCAATRWFEVLSPRAENVHIVTTLAATGAIALEARTALDHQAAFSDHDRRASPTRKPLMTSLIGSFIKAAERLLEAGVAPEAIAATPIFRALMRLGEEVPEGAQGGFAALERELTTTERRLAGALPATAASSLSPERRAWERLQPRRSHGGSCDHVAAEAAPTGSWPDRH